MSNEETECEPTLVIPVGKFKIPRSTLELEVSAACPQRLVDDLEKLAPAMGVGIDIEGVIGRPVGWAQVEARDDGVWASEIRLSEAGRFALATFRYLQPVFSFAGGRIDRIVSLSLAREPARWESA